MAPNDGLRTMDIVDLEAARLQAHEMVNGTSRTFAAATGSSAGSSDEPVPIEFRDMEAGDIPHIRDLQSTLFPVQYPDSFYERLFQPGYFCQVGITPDGLIATVASARVVDYNSTQPSTEQADASREAYLMTLGVREGFRRHKLGTRALEQILKLLAKRTRAEYAALHVKSANRAAVNFYVSNGWTCDPVDGHLPQHYYIDGAHWDAFRYTKPLRNPFSNLIADLCVLL